MLEMIEAGLNIKELLTAIDDYAEAEEQRQMQQLEIIKG